MSRAGSRRGTRGLNRRVVLGVTRYLVRWRGQTLADDEWLRGWRTARRRWRSTTPRLLAAAPLAGLGPTPCRRLLQPAVAAAPPPAAPPPLVAPAGFRPGPRKPAGGPVLFYWPTDDWVRGTVARSSRAAGTRMSSGTTGGRRWALLWLIRSSMPLRTARGATGLDDSHDGLWDVPVTVVW